VSSSLALSIREENMHWCKVLASNLTQLVSDIWIMCSVHMMNGNVP
jgi:hypothetical protein